MKKKILTLLLSIAVILTSTVTMFAEAQTIPNSNVTWELTENDTILKIAGTGDMPDLSDGSYPWMTKKGNIISIIVESGVTNIGCNTFEHSSKLTNVTIPSTVTKIGNYAFGNCTSLSTIVCNATTPPIAGTFIFPVNETLTSIYVPADKVHKYKEAAGWSTYADKIKPITPELKITKSDDSNAVEGADYIWESVYPIGQSDLSGLKLVIKSNNLTISSEGNTINNTTIYAGSDISELTIKNLKIANSGPFCIDCLESTTINVEGVNELSNTNDDTGVGVIICDTNGDDAVLTLTGSGSLTATFTDSNNSYVIGANTIKMDMSDNLICDGSDLCITCRNIIVTDDIGTILAHSKKDGYSAISWGSDVDPMFGNYVITTVSGEADDDPDGEAVIRDGAIKTTEGAYAKNILMKGSIGEVDFTYGDFNFDNFTLDTPDVPTNAKYTRFEKAELYLLLGSEGVASSPNYGGNWYVYRTDTPIDNIKEVEFDTIVFNVWFESEKPFNSNVTVKGNGVELNQLDDPTELYGQSEGFFLAPINVIASVKTANKYIITEGNKAKINKDSIKDTLFTSNADSDDFIEVRVDGKIITEGEDYTVDIGSTKATLKSTYLDKLALGEHTLAIISKDGQASTTFTITRNPKPNPGYIVPNTSVK